MARRVITSTVCDLAHDDGADYLASETLQFSVSGIGYVLDLCDEHADEVHGDLGALIAAGRRRSRRVHP